MKLRLWFLVCFFVTVVPICNFSNGINLTPAQCQFDEEYLISQMERVAFFRTQSNQRQGWGFRRTPNISPFAVITIPKSGTHLLIKALYLMGGCVPAWHQGLDTNVYGHVQYYGGNSYFPCTHFWISPAVEQIYQELNLKKIICIRDLRDVCVSAVHHAVKYSWPGLNDRNPQAFASFKRLSFDDQLLFMISYVYSPAQVNDLWQISVPILVEQAAAYSKNPDVYVCRYENLVGEGGGGSKTAQLLELKGLSEFLDWSFTDEQLSYIAEKLYGDDVNPFVARLINNDTSTFRNGKIGSWKTAFKPQHKAAFKKTLNKALIALGYEKDDNW